MYDVEMDLEYANAFDTDYNISSDDLLFSGEAMSGFVGAVAGGLGMNILSTTYIPNTVEGVEQIDTIAYVAGAFAGVRIGLFAHSNINNYFSSKKEE